MNYFVRMLEAGISPDGAFEAFAWFETQCDTACIADYVQEVENGVDFVQSKSRFKSCR